VHIHLEQIQKLRSLDCETAVLLSKLFSPEESVAAAGGRQVGGLWTCSTYFYCKRSYPKNLVASNSQA
jgi:hypothetical protein